MTSQQSVIRQDIIDDVIASFPVNFSLLHNEINIFVAYYNTEHQLCFAQRPLDGSEWTRQKIDVHIGWDSHNYIVMAFDADGYIHVSANMHVVPLIYFISDKPGDISSWTRQHQLIGTEEDHCTYPAFLNTANDELVFHYRDGSSGDGCEIYNIYDHQKKSWHRLLAEPLHDGLHQMSAYAHGPVAGADGNYHVCWVWRDNPAADTNHDISYMYSPDLISWYNAAGQQQTLPITPDNHCCIVDPVPVQGGAINGNVRMGFDEQNHIFLYYHKFDQQGITQVYTARLQDGQWHIQQISQWSFRWEFGGWGSLEFAVILMDPVEDRGHIAIPYKHRDYGDGILYLDPQSLELSADKRGQHLLPESIFEVTSPLPGMRVNLCGQFPARFILRWESLPNNRDKEPENNAVRSQLSLIECGVA